MINWRWIQSWVHFEQENTELAINLHSLTARFLGVLQQLSKAKAGLETKRKKFSYWINDQEKTADINGGENFFLSFISYMLKRHQISAYLFDFMKDCSEWDYVIKLWSPTIVELFDSVNTLRTKWDDTVFELANEDETANLKIDIRVQPDTIVF
ncbi:hypothetical protein BD408DRAFT_431583 [Parasitella parasitica]|nr:hypothetical protein BD408DRAFT_431583 [Parasitella parasitica]